MKRSDVHLVKAAFHAQFKKTMQDCDLDSASYFRKVSLPAEIDDPESLLPLKPFFHLINIVAIENNIPDFGSRVARTTPWHKVASLGPLLAECETLGDLLTTFCQIASGQSTIVSFRLRKRNSFMDFCYEDVPIYRSDIQMELYRLTSMIQLVQLATDPDWRPALIRLNMPETTVTGLSPLLAGCRLRFSQADSAIAIAEKQLELPLHQSMIVKKVTGSAGGLDLETDISNSIRQILKSYLPGGKVAIEEVARISDLPVRTLQRRLRERGLKFNDMLTEARFEYAREQLKQTGVEIKTIAQSLGYSDAAHFTRAFRRWSGISPSEFARQSKS